MFESLEKALAEATQRLAQAHSDADASETSFKKTPTNNTAVAKMVAGQKLENAQAEVDRLNAELAAAKDADWWQRYKDADSNSSLEALRKALEPARTRLVEIDSELRKIAKGALAALRVSHDAEDLKHRIGLERGTAHMPMYLSRNCAYALLQEAVTQVRKPGDEQFPFLLGNSRYFESSENSHPREPFSGLHGPAVLVDRGLMYGPREPRK
jgi:hypothetical protein